QADRHHERRRDSCGREAKVWEVGSPTVVCTPSPAFLLCAHGYECRWVKQFSARRTYCTTASRTREPLRQCILRAVHIANYRTGGATGHRATYRENLESYQPRCPQSSDRRAS